MAYYRLWYVRRGDSVTGPFPSPLVTHYAEVGRILPDDEISPDKRAWRPFRDVPELAPLRLPDLADPDKRRWAEERLTAARRWADERYRPDRREMESANVIEKWAAERRGGERRKRAESPDVVIARRYRAARAGDSRARERLYGAIAALIALVLLVGIAVVFLSPVNPVKVGVAPVARQCGQAAAPRLNWSRCDKQGAWLKGADISGSNLSAVRLNSAQLGGANLSNANLAGADLSYANLSHARLSGANLARADLTGADLTDADLSHADLSGASVAGAELAQARLDRAIWPDGRRCGDGSLGQCR